MAGTLSRETNINYNLACFVSDAFVLQLFVLRSVTVGYPESALARVSVDTRPKVAKI